MLMQAKYKILEQIGFFSDSFKKIISDKLVTDQQGNLIPISKYRIELAEPECGIFSSCAFNVSNEAVVLMFDENNLKISHLKDIIQLIKDMSAFYGDDDNGYHELDNDEIEEIIYWDDIDIVSIIRIWEHALNSDCQVVLNFSLGDNNIFLVISYNLID
jgi:hypothetical protein